MASTASSVAACSRCGAKDHRAAACSVPFLRVFCSECGRGGHGKATCPVHWAKERKAREESKKAYEARCAERERRHEEWKARCAEREREPRTYGEWLRKQAALEARQAALEAASTASTCTGTAGPAPTEEEGDWEAEAKWTKEDQAAWEARRVELAKVARWEARYRAEQLRKAQEEERKKQHAEAEAREEERKKQHAEAEARKCEKKLREIAKIEERLAAGERVDPKQLEKVQRKADIEDALLMHQALSGCLSEEEEREARKLEKKLREIAQVEERLAAGDRVDPEQLEKLQRKADIENTLVMKKVRFGFSRCSS